MERKSNVLVNGGVKLPIGYRFHPTDEELVVYYLKRKAFGLPLPALVIPEFDVFSFHPGSLPGDVKEKKRYFFSRRIENCFGSNRKKRHACCGYWKPIGKEKHITASNGNQVGLRRSLVFYEKKTPSKCKKTRWVIREYCLLGCATTNQVCGIERQEEWAVYNVFERKKRAAKRKKLAVSKDHIKPISIDFTSQAATSDMSPPPPSSPTSSEDISNGFEDQHRITNFQLT